MKALVKWMWLSLMVLFASAALAQAPQGEYRRSYSQAELDQVLAPIALYPDSLLSQVLMASTYPQDVAEAASWSRANSGIRGDAAVRAVENEPWDPSVISLVAFPEVLAMMDERRDWAERLGDAYLAQPEQVMESVQELRRRADEAGTLRTTEEIVVQRQGDDYVIEPPTPEVVYVPYYDPRVAYGSWWWSDYPPVYWNPWPGYAWHPGYSGFAWGYGVTLGPSFFFGSIDWPRRYIRYSHYKPWYFHRHDFRRGDRWRHDHRGDRRWRDRDDRRWDRDGRRWDRDGRRGDRDGRRVERSDPRDVNRTRQYFERRDGAAPERRDGRTDRREWRGSNSGSRPLTPQAAAPDSGFFRALPEAPRAQAPATNRNPAVRPAAPAFFNDAGRIERRSVQRERPVRAQPATGISRPADTRAFSPPRAPQPAAPAPAPARAPVMRQMSPPPQPSRQQSAPAPRVSEERSPVQRGGRER